MSQTWDFANISSSVDSVQQQQSQIDNLLQEGQQVVQYLSSIWGGAGSASYQQVQQQWQNNTNQLNESLQQLASAIGEASDNMNQTDNSVAQSFGGIS